MGYTHYWNVPPEIDVTRFAAACEDCRKVCTEIVQRRLLAGWESQPVVLAREYDSPEAPPEFGPEVIFFNGVGDLGHETFVFPTRPGFAFCKTSHKPYDLAVCCCLIVLHQHLALSIDSDGRDEEAGWVQAREICQEVLGYGRKFQIQRAVSKR